MDIESFVHSMVALMVAIIAILMLTSLCRHFYCNKANKMQYYAAIQTSSIICLIAYIIRLTTLFMLHIPFYCPSCSITHVTASIWQIISALFLFISKPLTQIHYVLRLHYTFSGSAFQSNQSIYIVLWGIIVTEILCILLYFSTGVIQLEVNENSPLTVEDDFDEGNYGKPFESSFAISLLIIVVITDLIVSYIITHLFVSKLFKLLVMGIQSRADIKPMVQLFDTDMDDMGTESDHDMNALDVNQSVRKLSSDFNFSITHVHKIKLLKEDTKLIYTITRYTLLSSMTMILTQIYFMLQLIHILLISFHGNLISYHHLDAPLAALSITDSLIAISSVYLNFVFSRKWYRKFCNVCHKSMENICERLTHKTILKRNLSKDADGYFLID